VLSSLNEKISKNKQEFDRKEILCSCSLLLLLIFLVLLVLTNWYQSRGGVIEDAC